MSAYNDKNISLQNIALTQFEMAREIPAAIDLFSAKPQNLDIQTRMIILKVNAAMYNFKSKNKVTLVVGLDFLSFLNPMMMFLHGNRSINLEIFSFALDPYSKKTKVNESIEILTQKNSIFSSDTEMVASALKKDTFLIAVLGSASINPAREVIDAFSFGKEGLLLIHNYAVEKSPSHHLYAVERGLRLLENPDGSGECYSL